jgi:hypothetical protein
MVTSGWHVEHAVCTPVMGTFILEYWRVVYVTAVSDKP